MEFKGTQFEWELHPNTSFGDGNRVRSGHVICMRQNGELKAFAGTWTPFNSMTDEEELANATLMVNARELLETLQHLVKESMLSHAGDEIAKQAIEKATHI